MASKERLKKDFFDAFISYSHEADRILAPSIQKAIETYGKPWYRRRVLRVFRDQTNIGATPHLWPTILGSLERSRYFILMASPEASQSKWVKKEISFWLERKNDSTILIILSKGSIQWDDESNDFDWSRTTALPKTLSSVFKSEPLHIDFSDWNNEKGDLSLKNTKFSNLVLQLAAPIRGMPVGHEFGHAYICLSDITLHIHCCLIHDWIKPASKNAIQYEH